MISSRKSRKAVLVLTLLLIAGIGVSAGLLLLDHKAGAPATNDVASNAKPVQPAAVKPPQTDPPFDMTKYSTTDPSSLWVVVNKQHPLSPVDYAPSDLVTAFNHQVSSRMVTDLTQMIGDAAKDGAYLTVISSYRSYQYQISLYDQYVKADGQAKADTYSARPGFSEHQTGLAIDFGNKAGSCPVEQCFENTTEGKWLEANAYKYGYLLRYTTAEQSVTGYEAEAWHYRYVGRDLSMQMHDKNIPTLEQFFGISGGETYIQ